MIINHPHLPPLPLLLLLLSLPLPPYHHTTRTPSVINCKGWMLSCVELQQICCLLDKQLIQYHYHLPPCYFIVFLFKVAVTKQQYVHDTSVASSAFSSGMISPSSTKSSEMIWFEGSIDEQLVCRLQLAERTCWFPSPFSMNPIEYSVHTLLPRVIHTCVTLQALPCESYFDPITFKSSLSSSSEWLRQPSQQAHLSWTLCLDLLWHEWDLRLRTELQLREIAEIPDSRL